MFIISFDQHQRCDTFWLILRVPVKNAASFICCRQWMDDPYTTSKRSQSQMQPRYGLCKTCIYGSNWYVHVDATLDAWEDAKTSTSCPEAWHTIEDILEDGFDAITLVPHMNMLAVNGATHLTIRVGYERL